jgi:hypothetical protein
VGEEWGVENSEDMRKGGYCEEKKKETKFVQKA